MFKALDFVCFKASEETLNKHGTCRDFNQIYRKRFIKYSGS